MIPRTGKSTHALNSKVKQLIVALAVLFTTGFTLAVLTFLWYQPLNSLAAVIKLGFYSLPIAIVGHFVFRGILSKAIAHAPKQEIIRTLFYISLLLFPFCALTYVNAKFDTSAAELFEVPVDGKYSKVTKKRTMHYIWFKSPKGASCCFLPEESDRLVVNKEEFQKVVPHQTKLQLQVRSGLLELPWLENHLLKYEELSTNKTNIESVLKWTAEPIEASANEFREDKWPNGNQKTKEPLIQGQIHGFAKYWHSNGQLYAEIPYKGGMKHGRFKIFRENGTVNQELSYKNGVLHGLSRWYDENGSVKQQTLYIEGQNVSLPSENFGAEPTGSW